MGIHVYVFDASGNRLGPGPIATVNPVQVARALDGPAGWSFNVPAADSRALALLQEERRVEIYEQMDDERDVRLLGAGVIKQRTAQQGNPPMVTVSGQDLMTELRDRSTLIARLYQGSTVSAVATGLIADVSGWSVTVEGGIASNGVDARFDGASTLAAFRALVEDYGYHIRLSPTVTRRLEVGAFGADSGLRILNTAYVTQALYDNPNVLLVTQLTETGSSKDIVNRVYPYGGGEGAAALTLAESTRPGVLSTTANGFDQYYIRDATSEGTYGIKERVISFKKIQPLSNSVPDRLAAANALFDAAQAYLDRSAVLQKSYRVQVTSIKERVNPGDKVRVQYRGQVFDQVGNVVNWVDINDDFWVLSVTEQIGPNGISATLDIRNVDQYEKDTAEIVVNAVEEINLRGLRPQTKVTVSSYVYTRMLAPGFPAVVPIEITNATLDISRVRVRVKTRPFRANSKEAQTQAQAYATVFSGSSPLPLSNHFIVLQDEDGDSFEFNVSGNGDLGAFFAVPSLGVVPLQFEINDDTQHPQTISIFVNGIDRTTALGGTLAPSNAAIDELLDVGLMTGYLRNASGGLQQVHEVEFRAGSGRGEVEITVEVYGLTQSVRV